MTAIAGVGLLTGHMCAQTASFQGLGEPAGQILFHGAYAVSDDGTVAAAAHAAARERTSVPVFQALDAAMQHHRQRAEGYDQTRSNSHESLTMAHTLFDLSPIDLDAVVVSYEEVGRLNPHRGDMRQLDHIIWMSADRSQALGVKHVHDDEFWVPFHMPGKPHYPATLMIEAAAQVCSVRFRLKDRPTSFIGFSRCDDMNFYGQVEPGDTLLLLCTELEHNSRRFIAACQGVVNPPQGRIVFEGRITGLVM